MGEEATRQGLLEREEAEWQRMMDREEHGRLLEMVREQVHQLRLAREQMHQPEQIITQIDPFSLTITPYRSNSR